MEIRELAKKCKERNVECDNCPYVEECEQLTGILEDISPVGLINMVNENHKIY